MSTFERPHADLGARIRESRVTKGLSQKELAQALKVTVQSVSQWETGRSLPEADRQIGLSIALGVQWSWLKTGAGKRERILADSTKGNDLLDRYAPVIPRSEVHRVSELRGSGPPEDLDFYSLFATEGGNGELFALLNYPENPAPPFSESEIWIFDTGISPRPGDFVVCRWTKDDFQIAQVRSVTMDDDGGSAGTVRPIHTDRPEFSLSLTGKEPTIFGVMVEKRALRRR